MARKTTKRGAVTAGEFFAEKLPDGNMTDAHRATGLGYTTIRLIADGTEIEKHSVGMIRQLADWSRTVAEARKQGIWIDVAKTLGLGKD